MVDNVSVTPGSGAIVAADDIGSGVLVQRVKTTFGVDGTATDVSSSNPLPATVSGTVSASVNSILTNPTSTLTRPANTTAYAVGDVISSNTTAGSVVVPSFAIANSAGAAIIPRLRLSSNVTTGWSAISLQVNLWTAAPTYTNGDNGAYAVATGAAGYLGSCQISLNQFGDGAVGVGAISNGANIKLASGTSIFWDLQIVTGTPTPTSGQTFTLTAEVEN